MLHFSDALKDMIKRPDIRIDFFYKVEAFVCIV